MLLSALVPCRCTDVPTGTHAQRVTQFLETSESALVARRSRSACRARPLSLLGGHTGRFVPVFAHLASGLALPCLERAQAGAAAGNARKIGAKTALGRRLATTALLHAPHGAKRGSATKTGAGMVSVHQCARRTAGAQRGVGPGRARKRGAKMEPSQLPVAPAVAVRRAQYRR